MSISEPFIRRPIATATAEACPGAARAGDVSLLPIAPAAAVDFPTISVQRNSRVRPDTMAATVAAHWSAVRADRRRHADDLDVDARLDLRSRCNSN